MPGKTGKHLRVFPVGCKLAWLDKIYRPQQQEHLRGNPALLKCTYHFTNSEHTEQTPRWDFYFYFVDTNMRQHAYENTTWASICMSQYYFIHMEKTWQPLNAPGSLRVIYSVRAFRVVRNIWCRTCCTSSFQFLSLISLTYSETKSTVKAQMADRIVSDLATSETKR